MSWTVIFPDSYSGGILTWMGCEDSVDWTFHDMVAGSPRLKFRAQGPDEIHQ